MDIAARLETVEVENEMLREQIAKLELLLGMQAAAPIEFRLTGKEEGVFGVLMAREIATKEMVMFALYSSLGKDEAEPKIVDVFICKIRRKLKPFGIDIKTVWGKGYYLTPEAKRSVKELTTARLAA